MQMSVNVELEKGLGLRNMLQVFVILIRKSGYQSAKNIQKNVRASDSNCRRLNYEEDSLVTELIDRSRIEKNIESLRKRLWSRIDNKDYVIKIYFKKATLPMQVLIHFISLT